MHILACAFFAYISLSLCCKPTDPIGQVFYASFSRQIGIFDTKDDSRMKNHQISPNFLYVYQDMQRLQTYQNNSPQFLNVTKLPLGFN